jgi:hypothetical protein
MLPAGAEQHERSCLLAMKSQRTRAPGTFWFIEDFAAEDFAVICSISETGCAD